MAKVFGTEDEMWVALRKLWPAESYALFRNVPDATAGRASRRADALVQGLWPSRGLTLCGVEIKVSRSDWLRELRDHAKSHDLQRFCDHWYLAVGDDEIVKPGELPATWGMIAPKRGGLAVVQKAPRLEPVPIDRAFLAALLRASQHDRATEGQLAAARLDGIKIGRQQQKEAEEIADRHVKSELQQLQATIAAFERAAGQRLSTYTALPLGRALGLFRVMQQTGHPADRISLARSSLAEASRALDAVARAMADLDPNHPLSRSASEPGSDPPKESP